MTGEGGGLDAAEIVSRNVAALFEYAKAHHDPDRSTAALLEAYIRRQQWGDAVGKSTIYRMRNGDAGIAVGVIELVARGFGLQAWHLLFPGLDPANPPAMITTDVEKSLYADFKELQRRLRAAPDLEVSEVESIGEGPRDSSDHASGKSSKGNAIAIQKQRGRIGAENAARRQHRKRGHGDDD